MIYGDMASDVHLRLLAATALLGLVLGAVGCVDPNKGSGDGASGQDDASQSSADGIGVDDTGAGDTTGPAGDAGRDTSTTGGEAGAPLPDAAVDVPVGATDASMNGTAPNGAACSASATCASGQCVDGLCCESACNGQCESCAESGSPGKCGPVTGAPRGTRVACAGQGSVCGAACNGTNRVSCTYPAADKECAAASCQGGTAYARSLCDGKGACGAQTSVACGAAGCAGAICAGGCSAQNPCAASEYCNGGRCFAKLANGAACTAPESCTSGKCVDGVCCTSACNGTCEACVASKTGGADGSCLPIAAGKNPDAECADNGASSCGTDGTCDGARACHRYVGGTPCAAAACGNGSFTPARTCNGTGACGAATPVSCGSYACFASGCRTSCSVDADCLAPNACVGGSCGSKKGQGVACSSPGECASGSCVDGVCCENGCTGACTACRQLKTGQPDGKCAPVSAGTDPDNECGDQGASSCGTDGTCNGAGACRKYPSGTGCGAGGCTGTKFVGGGKCDGNGTCGAGTQTECSPYACTSAGCKAAPCASDVDCASGNPGFGCSDVNTCKPRNGTWLYMGYFGAGEIITPPGPDPSGPCVSGTTVYYKVATTPSGIECQVTRDPSFDFSCSNGLVAFSMSETNAIRDCATSTLYTPSGYRRSLPNFGSWCLPPGSTTAACVDYNPQHTGCDRGLALGRLFRCYANP
jgi:hypothetical protein